MKKKLISESDTIRQQVLSGIIKEGYEGEFCEDGEFSLNEDKDGNYMTIRNLNNIFEDAKMLLSHIKEGDKVDDWIEDKISRVTESLNQVSDFYKAK